MNILRRLDDAVKLQRGEMVRPHMVDFHTSNLCNMDCLGCAYRGTLTREYMPEFQHFQAVDTFLGVGVKAFDFAGGGEPTCLPYLPRLMQHIADRDAHFALITNGLLMSDELVDVLVEHGTYCRISLEASSRDDYAAYKRVKAEVWDRVLENVRRLVSERNGRKSGLEVSLRFSVGRSLRGGRHYERIRDLAYDLGVDRVTIKALRHEPEELTDAEKEDEAGLQKSYSFPRERVWIEAFPESRVPQCYLNPLHTVMDHRGDIYLCCFYYKRPESHRIGNIFEKPFEEIWFSDEHQQKIAAIRRDECAIYDCKFFGHHEAAKAALTRGAGYWL